VNLWKVLRFLWSVRQMGGFCVAKKKVSVDLLWEHYSLYSFLIVE
jgi:hypothetical protein